MPHQQATVEPNEPGPGYCVLVSSCDAYADCWPPFFKLMAEYWRPASEAIYLNTETSTFTFPGLNIRPLRPELELGRSLHWSERLIWCLEQIPHEVVLYLQEDYFINDVVDVEMIDRLAAQMLTEEISHIGLWRGSSLEPGPRVPQKFLREIPQRAEWRISAQAGLWKKSALKSYLRRHENVWEFEWYGTRRAWRKRDKFLYVGDEYRQTHGRTVIPYVPTGVVRGRWIRDVVVDLFAAHQIDVDYDVRGFADEYPAVQEPTSRVKKAFRRLRSIR